MPSKEAHEEQVRRNKQLIAYPNFDTKTCGHNDWVVTVAFYTALHLVEREFAKIPYDCRDHKDREECMITSGGKFRDVLRDYKTLKAASMKTRYTCCVFSPDETDKYLNYLNNIENKLGKVS